MRGFVKRPRKIAVHYWNELGEEKNVVIEGFGARVFQHEVDHLNGQLFIDKVSDNKIAFIEEFVQFKLGEKDKLLDD